MGAGANTSGQAGVRQATSAGGVVLRRVGKEFQVVVCRRTGDQVLALPKGTPEPGETLEETALREVREETGLEVRATRRLGAIRYTFQRSGVLHDKTVHFYLMSPMGGDLALHDAEFDSVEWMDASRAAEQLTHANESGIVETALSVAAG